MCFSVKTPKVENTVAGSTLVPSTNNVDPASPVYGGTENSYNKKKGKNALKVALTPTPSYNPLSI